jgi:CubicO group peptidase (beta-lactamase class C family)
VSKLFTATAVMQLFEQGKVQLDEDVNAYLTTFKIPATFPKPVTLHSLMTHTAGFDERGIGMAARTAKEWRPLGEYLADRMPPRVRPVGDGASYSNHGVGLEGYVVEQVSGMPFNDYIAKNIYQPLGMTPQHVRDHRPAATHTRAGLQVRRPSATSRSRSSITT